MAKGSLTTRRNSYFIQNWKKVLAEGINKESKIKFLKMYPRKGNCPIDTPKLNPEVEAIVNDTAKKRDKYLAIDQDLCGASLSLLGKAVNMILNDKKAEIDRKELLTALIDSGRLMCELFKQLTKARKAFIYPGLDKKKLKFFSRKRKLMSFCLA